jgi:hypothetical protein
MEPTARRGSGRVLHGLRPNRVDLACVAGLMLLAVLIPLVLGAAAGALGIPRNDDWDFRKVATSFWQTGRIVFDRVAEMTLIGQIVLVQPLLWFTGGDPSAFAIAGAGASTALALGGYALGRAFLPPARAFAACLALLLFPGFLAYDTSFMSDVPALAAQIAALLLGVTALRRAPTDLRRLALALALGVLAFSIRQVGLASIVALVIAAILREPRRPAIWLLALSAATACLSLAALRAALPGVLPAMPLNIWFATRLPLAAATISFSVLPAVVIAIAANRNAWGRRAVGYGAAIGGLAALSIAAMWVRFGTFPDAFIGNLTSQQGVLDVLDPTGGRPALFPDPVWALINLAAIGALVLFMAVAAATVAAALRARPIARPVDLRGLGTPVGLLIVFVLVYGGGMAAFGSVHIVFDRYLWPLVPPIAVLVLIPQGRRQEARTPSIERRRIPARRGAPWIATAATAIQGVLAVVLMANALAFDAARWRAGEAMVAAGLRPDTIDAGYEWVGYHATGAADLVSPTPTDPPYRGWWKDFERCGVVASGPLHVSDAKLIGLEAYQLYLLAGPVVDLHLYQIDRPDCPSA